MTRRLAYTLSLAVVLAGVLVLDLRACLPSYDFDEAELRAAIEGTWKLVDGAHAIRFSVKEAREARHSSRGFVRAAAACGHRTFVRSAEACMDTTEMTLDVELIAGAHGTASGRLFVGGTRFESADLELELDGELVTARVAPGGAITDLWIAGASPPGATLTRER